MRPLAPRCSASFALSDAFLAALARDVRFNKTIAAMAAGRLQMLDILNDLSVAAVVGGNRS